jgi:predicted MFS family arabinose efflux permease
MAFVYGFSTRVEICLWWAAVAALVLFASFVACALLVHAYRKVGAERLISSAMLTIVVTVVTVFIMLQYTGHFNTLFFSKTIDNLSGLAMGTTALIDGDLLAGIDSLDDYDSSVYDHLRRVLKPMSGNNISIKNSIDGSEFNDAVVDWDRGIYRMVLCVINGRVCYVYSGEEQWGAIYPVDYPYRDTEYQIVYDNDMQVTFQDVMDYTGEYSYTLTPIHDSSGKVAGILEMGIDLRAYRKQASELNREITLTAIITVFVVMLLLKEITFLGQVFRKRVPRNAGRLMDVDAVRPLIFFVYLIDCFALIISPLFAQSLYTETLGIPMELGVAAAYSATFLFLGVSAVIGGRACEKTGLFPLLLISVGALLCGELLAGFSTTLWMFIAAKALVGTGVGLAQNVADTISATQSERDDVARGFSMSNAGYYAGTNCGIIMGTSIGAIWGYRVIYFTSAAVTMLMLIYILLIYSRSNLPNTMLTQHGAKTAESRGMSTLQFFFSRRVLGFFMFIIFPYFLCNSFIYYFFPLTGVAQGLSENNISRIVFAYGMVSIYAGPSLTALLLNYLNIKTVIIAGAAFLAGALYLYSLMPILSILIVGIVAFAIADSFSFTTQNVYYSQLDETNKYGSGAALGIENIINGFAQTASPYCFAAAMIFGVQSGIAVIATVFVICLILFYVTNGSAYDGRHQR